MEQIIESLESPGSVNGAIPDGKVFTVRAVALASFLGGPLAGGYIFAHNFKVLGDRDSARKWLLYSALITLALIISLFALNEKTINRLPQYLIPFITAGCSHLLFRKFQEEDVNEHLRQGGAKASAWLAAAYSLLISVVVVLLAIAIYFVKPYLSSENTLKINSNITIHYDHSLNDSIAEMLGSYINANDLLDNSSPKDLFLTDEPDFYKLTIIYTNPAILSDSAFLSSCTYTENFINFGVKLSKPVEIFAADQTCSNEYEIPEIDSPNNRFFKMLGLLNEFKINDNQRIFYNLTMPRYEAENLSHVLRNMPGYFPSDKELELIFMNKGDYYLLKIVSPKDRWEKDYYEDKLLAFINYFKVNNIISNIQVAFIDPFTMEESPVILRKYY